MQIESVMAHIHNYFVVATYKGNFTVEDGSITLPFSPLEGQYFRIQGSVLNDGVFQYSTQKNLNLIDETFEGTISALAVPKRFLNLVNEIESWQGESGNQSEYASESFGGYSYSKPLNSKGTGIASWEDKFSSRLDEWRKTYEQSY